MVSQAWSRQASIQNRHRLVWSTMTVLRQTRTSSLGPHVRFRRVQTLVREGSPLVKLRNSA
jgi:hypothetical protein